MKEYLRHTNVSQLAHLIDLFGVRKARINSLTELGNLRTLWSDLGGLRSESILSFEKFRVRDVMQVLRSPECTDKTTLKIIQNYIARISQIEMVITVKREDTGEYRIYDGNKRTVAYYEALKKGSQVDFEFFLLSRDTGQLGSELADLKPFTDRSQTRLALRLAARTENEASDPEARFYALTPPCAGLRTIVLQTATVIVVARGSSGASSKVGKRLAA